MCPNCAEALLVLELDGIEIDYCESCSGLWLDEGELELILASEEAKSEALVDDIANAKALSKVKKRCVRCGAKMEEIKVGPDNVKLDRCPLGDGIWFDKNELKHLINSQKDEAGGIVAKFLERICHEDLSENPEGDS